MPARTTWRWAVTLVIGAVMACELPTRPPAITDALADLAVSPKVVTLQQYQSADFTAIAFTSTGDTANASINWSVTSGSMIDTATTNGKHHGRYKAGSDTGKVKVVARGNPNGPSDTAVVTVTPATVATVAVSPASANVIVGQTAPLTATPKDANGNALTGRAVTWATSNAAVAAVSGNGLVTGGAAGTATITASSEGQNGTATITVTLVPVASVSVSPSTATVLLGQTVQLTATPKDANGSALTGRAVTWASSTPGVASVSASGLVTAVAAGTATLTATSEGRNGTATITVTIVPVASVAVSPAGTSLVVGQTAQLSATTRDSAGNLLTGRTITWTSSSTTVATVNATGLVTAKAAGSATITATSEGRSGTAAVTVTVAPTAPVASVTVTPSTASLPVGSAVQLVAVARDSAGTILQGRLMTWRSGDSLVAKVTAVGLVTAVAAGGTFVIATSEGRSDTAQVTVTVPPPPDTTLGVALPPRLAASTGQTFYVAPGGSDANPGTAAAPWRTLQHAMNALAPGQRALVRAGTYETGGTFGTDADTYNWSDACSAAAPCTIAAYPGEKPIIHGMLKISGSYLRLSGFIIEGPLSRDVTSASERRANQIDLSDAHDVELSGNEIRNNDYHAGITAYRVYNIHVIGNWIHDNGRFTIEADPQTGSSTFNVDHGVYWGSTSGGGNLIANNLIERNRGNGLQLYPNTYDVIVTENTIVHNGNTGVYVGGSADRITVVNNISAFNERNAQMRIKSGTASLVRGNLVYSPTSAWSGIENTTSISVSDNLITDPAFANRLGGDFRLTLGSPALDRALAAYALVVDYLGAPRPRGAGADLGAYER